MIAAAAAGLAAGLLIARFERREGSSDQGEKPAEARLAPALGAHEAAFFQRHRKAASAPPEEPPGLRVKRMLESDAPSHPLTLAQIESYLAENRTNALSLVTAFEASRDREYLRRALQAFPEDPLAQTKALFHNVFPERRAELIDALKKSDPGNSLPYLLAAQDRMKEGDAAKAVEAVRAAGEKRFNDYTRESIVGLEEAYLASGYSVLDAKAMGSSSLLLPGLAPLKALASQAADLAVAYGKSGDVESQKAMLEASWTVGTQLMDSGRDGVLLNNLVGLAAQNLALSRWPDGEAFPGGLSVAEKLASNKAFRREVRESAALFNEWLPNAPEHEIITYYDRIRSFGEQDAMTWLKQRHPELAPAPAP